MTQWRVADDDPYADRYAEMIARRKANNADDPILPPRLAEIGAVDGQKLLDSACGEGYLARLLARRGAAVTDIDLSPRLIASRRAPLSLPARFVRLLLHQLQAWLTVFAGFQDMPLTAEQTRISSTSHSQTSVSTARRGIVSFGSRLLRFHRSREGTQVRNEFGIRESACLRN